MWMRLLDVISADVNLTENKLIFCLQKMDETTFTKWYDIIKSKDHR